jgi:hypothetical protein
MIDLYSIGSMRLGFGHQYRIETIRAEAQNIGLNTNKINIDLNNLQDLSSTKEGEIAIIDFINPHIFGTILKYNEYNRIYYLNDLGWTDLPHNFVSLPTQNIVRFEVSRNQHKIIFDENGNKSFIESTDFINYYKKMHDKINYELKDSIYIALGSNPRYISHDTLIKMVKQLRNDGIERISLLLNEKLSNDSEIKDLNVRIVNKLDFEDLDSHRFVITGGGFLKQEVACLNKEMAVIPINKHQELLSMAFSHRFKVPILRKKKVWKFEFKKPLYCQKIKPQNGADYILSLVLNKTYPEEISQSLETLYEEK